MRFALRLIAVVLMLLGIGTSCILTASLFNSDIASSVGATVEAVTRSVMTRVNEVNVQAISGEVD